MVGAGVSRPAARLSSPGTPGRVSLKGVGEAAVLDVLSVLFAGFEPNEIFGHIVSVDMAELLLVFGTIAASLGIMVVFGNWWSR
jgi:hypothetical protein